MGTLVGRAVGIGATLLVELFIISAVFYYYWMTIDR